MSSSCFFALLLFINFKKSCRISRVEKQKYQMQMSVPGLSVTEMRDCGKLQRAPRRIARNRRQRQANRALRAIRMQIEHSIGFHKVYASINSVFRHKRCFLPFVVCTCGFLLNRRKLIIRRLRHL